jgi:CHASE3 domain sensor protein
MSDSKQQRLPFFQRSFAMFGLIMVVTTITLVGIVGFSLIDRQNNTQVATTTSSEHVAEVSSVQDIDKVTQQLDTTQLEALDAELEGQFDF